VIREIRGASARTRINEYWALSGARILVDEVGDLEGTVVLLGG
jgi:hypothetical protein